MLHIVCPATVLGRQGLVLTSAPPRPMLWRGLGICPRSPIGKKIFWRLLFEQSLPRYLIALTPFPVAMVIWPELTLPIAQAPLAMFILVYWVEANVLAVPTKEKRAKLMPREEADRGLDLLRVRLREVLTRIAAGRPEAAERMHLVVEQSPLKGIVPLTLVSVQIETADGPRVLDLTEAERAMIEVGIFDEALPETLLLRINLTENEFLRSSALDPATISAPARLLAMAGG